MTKATARSAVGSIFGAVAAAATTITSIFETTADSVSMLNRYVDTAKEKQSINIDYDLATYEQAVFTTAAMEETKRNHEVKAFFKEDPSNEEMFKTSYSRIQLAVAERRGNPIPSSE